MSYLYIGLLTQLSYLTYVGFLNRFNLSSDIDIVRIIYAFFLCHKGYRGLFHVFRELSLTFSTDQKHHKTLDFDFFFFLLLMIHNIMEWCTDIVKIFRLHVLEELLSLREEKRMLLHVCMGSVGPSWRIFFFQPKSTLSGWELSNPTQLIQCVETNPTEPTWVGLTISCLIK